MKKNEKTKKIIFYISLGIHLLFLLLLTFNAFKRKQAIILKAQAQAKQLMLKKKIAKGMPSALRPKYSDGGTEVVFIDQYVEPKKPVKKEEPKQKQLVKKEIKKTKQPTKKITKKKPIKKTIKQVKKKTAKKVLKKTALQKKPAFKIKPKLLKKKLLIVKKEVKPQEPEKTEEEIKESALSNILKVAQKQPKKKTLLSLTKCFLDDEKGNSCLFRFGQNKFPGLEELKYICYEKQIEEHIISTWQSLYNNVRMQPTGKTQITFLIQKDGHVQSLELLSTSGNKQFDNMVLNCIRSTRFPPIPNHFGVDTYRPRGGLTVLPCL